MLVMEITETLPAIKISNAEEARLSAMAAAATERVPEVATVLLRELERAEVLPDNLMPADVVRIGSTAEVEIDDGRRLTVTLVLPAEADINAGRISVLTPVGAAILGLSPGQSMKWSGNDGREHMLAVTSVVNSEGDLGDSVGV